MANESNADANVQQAVPFFNVACMNSSLRFYVDGLGFRVADRWVVDGAIRWCRLELGGAAIMLQQFPTEGHDSWRPSSKVGDGVCICLMCTDALRIYREVTARGVACRRPIVGNGLWVVGCSDPDGYRIEFESPTDAPEDAEYPAG